MAKRIISVTLSLVMILSLLGTMTIVSTQAADTDPKGVYLTPTGAGTKDGSSWANAMEGDKANALTAAWDKTADDGTLYVGAGEYKVVQTLVMAKGGGSLDALKKMVGVNDGDKRPQFTGDYAKMAPEDKGTAFISLNEGVKYIQIENLLINNYAQGVYTNGLNEGLRFYNLDMNYVCDGFYLDGHSTAEAKKGNKDIIIDGSDVFWHRKRVVRFRGGNADAIVSNCTGDAGGKEAWRKGNWPVGVAFEADKEGVWEERIIVADSTFANCYQESDPASGYWNSDGISGERTSRDLTFIRCNTYGTTDAGWDLKTLNPTLIDCVAMDNKRNYKFWALGQATLVNCLGAYANKRGGSGIPSGIIVNGGEKGTTDTKNVAHVAMYNSTLYNNKGCQVREEGGEIKFYNCILGSDDPENIILSADNSQYKNNGYQTYNTVEYIKGVTGEDPQIKAASPDLFDGKSDKWNSQKYNGSIGYHFDSNKAPAVYSKAPTGYGAIVDVNASYDWAKEAIEFMVKNDYLPGRSKVEFGPSTVFAPSYNLTRAEFATMLVRTLGLKSQTPATFLDVNADFVYANDIGIAKAVGVVKGDDTGNFAPMAQISRQDVMVMLDRALKLAGKIPQDYNAKIAMLDKFKDKGQIDDYAKQNVANMIEKGIIKGNDDGSINPQGNTTRAEGAVIGKRNFDLK